MQGRRVVGITLLVVLAAFAAVKAQGLLANQQRIYVAISDGKTAKAAPRNTEAFHVWENGVVRPVVRISFEGASTSECETRMLEHAMRDKWFYKAVVDGKDPELVHQSGYSVVDVDDEEEEEDEDDD